ncbi:ABC transporter permease [Candidatus Saccharibacteria bacterium]|nr:ABC transporter permease [Candidatus Saccharibacteria bacterium]
MYAKGTQDAITSSASLTGEPVKYDDKHDSNGLYTITEEQIEQIKNLDGIKKDTVLVGKFGRADFVESEKTGEQYEVSTNMMTGSSVHYDLIAGSNMDNHSSDYEIILPSDAWVTALGYENADAAIGKTLKFAVVDPVTHITNYFDAKIVGIQAPSVITGSSIIINETLNNALYDENTKYATEEQKNSVYTIAAEYDYEHISADEIKDRLQKIGIEAITIKDITGEIKSFFDVVITVFQIFGYIALLAAAIGIINTLYMSVQERTREIGLEKALGMSKTKIFLEFALEAILLGFWGSVLGTVVSMLLVTGFDAAAHASDGFLQTFPTFHLGEFTIGTILPPILTVMIIAFIASVLPAVKASRKDPIDALRYE